MSELSGSVRNAALPATRGYQQEMLDESLRKNIIIALDTGSGKTHIAILRMKLEADREPRKVSWFIAPTVALCEQQRDVIDKALPVSVGIISGSLEPDQWKDPALWRRVLDTHRVMVSTPQVLLDALRHGYINLGKDIGLIVFDEAHHAVDNHPYNRIMKEFYFALPRRPHGMGMRPMILGLTASPIYGGHVEQAFRVIEANLDCAIRAPQKNRNELSSYVHRPVFKHKMYHNAPYSPSVNILALQVVLDKMNIEDDPAIQNLRKQLANLPPGPERTRVDQKLSKWLSKEGTYTHKGLRDLHRTAVEICADVGPWAGDWYIETVLEQARTASNPYHNLYSAWQNREKKYLMEKLAQVKITPTSSLPKDIVEGTSNKVDRLIECLEQEKAEKEACNEEYSGLIFVTRRDAVLALAEVLSRHPRTRDVFQVGSLIGNSDSSHRHSFLDITRTLIKQTPSETLRDFRIKEKNLIVATAVAEEGIDIQACGNVIRWDPPQNMASWAQSRGRARRERSSFILMFSDDNVFRKQVLQWEGLEKQMVALYNDPNRQVIKMVDETDEMDEDDEELLYSIPSTGAVVTLHSAIGHLAHFCSILPGAAYGHNAPLYDIDPPDFPEGWHANDPRHQGLPYPGPFGATVTLPRYVDADLRVHTVPRKYPSKMSARRHAAYFAYITLYEAGLLNEHLLPLTSAVNPQDEDVQTLLKDVEGRAGTTHVTAQINPWIPSKKAVGLWFATEVAVEGLPPLRMLSRVRIPNLKPEDLPTLYTAERGKLVVQIRDLGPVVQWEAEIEQGRGYTRQLLWPLYGHRMTWDQVNFAYMFFPIAEADHTLWEERREWAKTINTQSGHPSKPHDKFSINGKVFGEHHSFPNDVTIIRDGGWPGKPYQFMAWKSDDFSSEQVEAFDEKYGVTVLLDPAYVLVDLISKIEVQYAKFIPAILRHLSLKMTVVSLKDDLFTESCPVSTAPLEYLSTAITAPVSQEKTNYQRMETLGDTVLKFLTSIHLLAEFPLWHEGYLAKRKDHAVSNANLAKAAVSHRLYRWIIRDRFVPRRWSPTYEEPVVVDKVDGNSDKESSKTKQELSTKVLADVVESLIGAAYLHGSFEQAMECTRFFGLGLKWRRLPTRVETIYSRTEGLPEIPTPISVVEDIIGYRFTKKHFIVEALTHPSYHTDLGCRSYDRMEFLGDAVLDMVVTDFLYHAPGKEYKPGHIHLRKTAIVNSHILAFVCLRSSRDVDAQMPRVGKHGAVTLDADEQHIYLWQCLLHSSMRVLEDLDITFGRFQKNRAEIEEALETGSVYPWAALTRLQAAKFFSDIIESVLGAVFLDSRGDFDVVRQVLERLGLLPILRRIVEADMDVMHPVSRLANWAAKRQIAIEYKFVKEKGSVTCVVEADQKEVARVTENHRGRASQDEVKFTAAEKAIRALQLQEEEEARIDEEEEEDMDENDPWWATADTFPL
ncbi:P-loop containing nucleoside triphosphate hydrolase protein [Gloeophyllum trabeum ATCC 11539]|uniref:p-loop containing nucleoside triphosphate hydrolase protein n=1 Tax=Gloeophyllum trabeum (strain ATCC 11539 / FP-39264 / Madison 617) TaxID=670483 RepID=S7Q323_GLOTA|nr:P-loop containing nucleoside triphosphate hydrolase protein [Gloeophyllum trabeum ATCC 11539]EPQ54406.1 P-loop containing nucleoside triphosphate hydrolase protein [Gloeophyllum trabeum ATCC 11539]